LPDLETLAVFVPAALVVLLVPGPAVMFLVARTVEEGRTAGVVSILGFAAGGMVHVAAAALGLSTILAQGYLALSLIKYVGAGYLVYLGVRTLRSNESNRRERKPGHPPLTRVFTEALTVNLLNPKSVLFFFAYLPQFVQESRGAASTQIMLLGFLFHLLSIVTDLGYIIVASSAQHLVSTGPRLSHWRRHFSGWSYIGLGVCAAISNQRHDR